MKRKALLALILALVLMLSACSGASGTSGASGASSGASSSAGTTGSAAAEQSEEPIELTITTIGYATDVLSDDNPLFVKIQELTNTKLHVNAIPSASYEEKFNAMLAGNTLTDAVYVPNFTTSTILMAAKAGAFWKLNDYVDRFENISKERKDILQYASVEGDLYGLPRERPTGRTGAQYRADWLEKLGLSVPTTIDEFYDLCVAFTQDDPDGNGQNDTYGVAMETKMNSLGAVLGWFGAPNKYAIDDSGTFTSMYDTQEYLDGMAFWRKLYEEGLMNQDFVAVSSVKDCIRSGAAGITLGAMDDSYTNLSEMQAIWPDVKLDVIPSIDAGKGPETLWSSGSGFAGYIGFPTSVNKTEEDLMRSMTFFDRSNTTEYHNAMEYGLEGIHWSRNDEGKITISPEQTARLAADWNNLGQLDTFKVSVNPADLDVQLDELRENVLVAINRNNKLGIFDPTAGLVSDTYVEKGSDLDNLILDAQAKYVMGQISEDQFKQEIQKWHEQGGDAMLKEYAESYQRAFGD